MRKIYSLFMALIMICSLATTTVNAEIGSISKDQELVSKSEAYISDYLSAIDGSHADSKRIDYGLSDPYAAGFIQYFYELNKEMDLFAKIISYEIHDTEINIEKNIATLNTKLDYELIYNSTNVESSARNMEFSFEYQQINDTWVLTKVKSSDIFYDALMDRFEENSKKSNINIDDFFSSEMQSMLDYRDFAKTTAPVKPISTPATKATYSYNSSDGVEYASVFAEADLSDYIFYNAAGSGGDCTNFVSQCVWAAYAGFDANNLSQAETNMLNNKCMVTSYPSGWHASDGGGYPNWESVTKFYDYCVSTKSKGPNGTGWGGYSSSQLSPYAPSVGNVLQWSDSSSSSSYEHSTYVTYNAYTGNLNSVYLSYHSSSQWNRPAIYLVSAYDYVRGISFSSASF